MRKAKSRYAIAKAMGIPASSLYYKKKLPDKDRALKIRIEEALRYFPSYGHRRLTIHLGANRKRIRRAMNLFGIKPYRRRSIRFRKHDKILARGYPNLVKGIVPMREGHVWAADFTYLPFKKGFVYLATVMDVFTREVLGLDHDDEPRCLARAPSPLRGTRAPRPSRDPPLGQYGSKVFTQAVMGAGMRISRTAPASPWENAFQESFFSQFKIDLGDPQCFATLGELVYAAGRTIWEYNRTRIHLVLKMPPRRFAELHKNLVENYSKERGT